MRKAALIVFSVAFSAAGLASCGGGDKAALLGTEPLDRVVEVENKLEALEAWAASGQKADILVRFDTFDDIAVIPPSLRESMKNAADHLRHGNTGVIYDIAPFLSTSGMVNLGRDAGLYGRVVWVMPVWRSVGLMQLESFKRYLIDRRGYRPEDLINLAVEGENIVGMLGGIPVTVTTVDDFDIGEEEAIVDIDLAYFTSLKAQNDSYGIGTASTLDFLRKLKEKNIRTRFVTVTLSNEDQSVPVIIRYLGDVIAQCIENPALLADTMPKWQTMIEAERFLGEEQFWAADSVYSVLIRDYPDDPGLYYTGALALAFMGRGLDSGRHIWEAFRLDGMYRLGFFQIANLVAMKGKLRVGEEIVNMQSLGNILPFDEYNYNMAIMYIAGGNPKKALIYLNNVAQYKGGSIDLYNLMYRAARDAGDEEEMVKSLEKLVGQDSGFVKEKMPWVFRELGILYEKSGRLDDATGMYRRYIETAPQDSIVPELKRKVLELRRKG